MTQHDTLEKLRDFFHAHEPFQLARIDDGRIQLHLTDEQYSVIRAALSATQPAQAQQSEPVKPVCAVRGLVAKNGMCSSIISGQHCGSDEPCQHKQVAPVDQDDGFDAAVRIAKNLHIGACITEGKLHATVMHREGDGRITVIATAEHDAASLYDRDCIAKMQPAQQVAGEVVAWAICTENGYPHSVRTSKESADRCAQRWIDKQSEKGFADWRLTIRPLTYADTPPAPASQPAAQGVPECQRYMVSSVQHKVGIVKLVTINADDVSQSVQAGQVVQLTASPTLPAQQGEKA